MGIWGAELYQNDTSLDIKDEFEELFKNGKTAREITEKLIEDYKGIMGKPDEEPLFWYALADTQWDFGVLLPEVKKKKTVCWLYRHSTQQQKSKEKVFFMICSLSFFHHRLRRKELLTEDCMYANGNVVMSLRIGWKAIWQKKKDYSGAIS